MRWNWRARARARRLSGVEGLERRELLANFSVTSLAASGEGSLAEAITLANDNPGGDTISFELPTDAAFVIEVSSLPPITDPVLIDGTTQLGYVDRPVVIIQGIEATPGSGVAGLRLEADGSVIRGLVLRGFQGTSSLNGSAIRVFGDGNRIQGNVIGSGDLGGGQVNSFGIVVESGRGNLIGGQSETFRNIISGNQTGVVIRSNENLVEGNYFGTDVSGAAAIGNEVAIEIDGDQNIVGGVQATQRNTIAGNDTGIVINGDGNRVEGNFIGVDPTGQAALGNDVGVRITQGQSNVIGGPTSVQGNTISANRDAIVIDAARSTVVQANRIGTSADGQQVLGNTGNGISLLGTGTQTVRIGGAEPGVGNVIAGSTGLGILINSNGNFVEGNVIGRAAGQAETFGNQSGGIAVLGSGNLIGGQQPNTGNQMNGNGVGIRIAGANATGNLILGNWIGTDAQANDLGNQGDGIEVSAPGTAIGGPLTGQANTIGHNGRHGIFVHQESARNTRIQGNRIGVGQADANRLPNAGNGVHVEAVGADSDILIGGATADEGNQIWFNGGAGVVVVEGLAGGAVATGVEIRANSIFQNDGIGIDLGAAGLPDGPTPNDPGDPDAGPNGLQNYPALTRVVPGEQTRIAGTLDSPTGTYRIDFYAGPQPDANEEVEGQRYLGSVTIGPTDLSFDVTLPEATQPTDVITATATSLGNPGAPPGTSELARLARIEGTKLNDLLGDGITADDVPLPDFTIRLYRDDGDGMLDVEVDLLVAEAVTDANGDYAFRSVLPGRHFVVERPDDRYSQSAGGTDFPDVPYYVLDVGSGEAFEDQDFANYLLPRLAGRKLLDIDNNGVSENDPPLAGWTIQLFRDDGNGIFQPGIDVLVDSAVTDDDGGYEFVGMPAGDYFVVELLQGDFEQTGGGDNYPSVPHYRRSLVGGTVFEELNFANFDFPDFRGAKFIDLQGDGITPDDDPFPGQTIQLYQDDGDGVFDPNVDVLYDTALTNLQGAFLFRRVEPGRYFVIDQVPVNFIRTAGGDAFPEVPYYTLQVESGRDVDQLDFANARVASIEGRVYLDRAGDGRGGDDVPLAESEVALYRDTNGDGLLDPTRDRRVAVATTDQDGRYRFGEVIPGPYLVFTRVTATTRQTAGGQDFPIRPYYVVRLVGGQNLTGRDFAQGPFAETGLVTRTIDAGDFDRDGDLDLVVVNEFAGPGSGSGNVVILLNDGSGNYPVMRSLPINGRPHDVSVVDLDGDPDRDLVVTMVGSGSRGPLAINRVVTYFGNGDGTFQVGEVYNNVGDGPIDVIAADFDRDGDADVAVASYRSDSITILRNQARGTLQPLAPVRVGRQPIALAAIDLDRDGDLDLVAANYGSNSLSLLENRGGLTFVARTSLATTPQPADLVVADFDSDGQADVAVAGFQFSQVELHYGLRLTTSGAASNRRSYSAGTSGQDAKPHALAALDYDGDGDLDLAVAESESNQISILEFRGGRLFTPGGTLSTDGGTESLVAGDVNGDGGADVASTTLYRPPLVNLVSARSLGGVNQSTNRNVDVAVAITNQRSVVPAGETMIYEVVVRNVGASRVEDAELRSDFPAEFQDVTFTSVANGSASGNSASGSGAIQDRLTLGPGASVTYTVQGTIDPAARGTLESRVQVDVDDRFLETNLENNAASDLDDLLAVVDLSVQTSDGGADEGGNVVEPGTGVVTYTATVTNGGPTVATEVELISSLELPPGTSVTAVNADQGSFDGTANRWLVGSLGIGDVATLTIEVAVDATAMVGDTIRHRVRVDHVAEIESTPDDDSAEAVTWIGPPPVQPPGTVDPVRVPANATLLRGDFDGNGVAETIAHFDGQLRAVEGNFATKLWGSWSSEIVWSDFGVGDFDGDGRDDIVARTPAGRWWVGISDGSTFANAMWGGWSTTVVWQDVTIADYDGDGRDDIAGRTETGDWWLARAQEDRFVNERWGSWSAQIAWEAVAATDVDGDGKADLVGRTPAGNWWAAVSTGEAFVNQRLLEPPQIDAAFASA